MADFALLESQKLISRKNMSDRKIMKFSHCGRTTFIFSFFSDLTTLFHPDKKEETMTSMESLVKGPQEEEDAKATYSVFMRNRAGSAGSDAGTNSAPASPQKEVKSPDFGSATPEPESPRVKTPKANFSPPEGSMPSAKNEANKQSCDPIPEVDEDDR